MDLDELVLAYAVSVHKSQGSEYPAVLISVLSQHYVLFQRNLISTAVTRAKRLVVIVGTKKPLQLELETTRRRSVIPTSGTDWWNNRVTTMIKKEEILHGEENQEKKR